ncbi:MAG: formimidoylglutamate deiminase, partial [Pseudomonadota bacterium]|nr:formimidoylglutamate deiminase [Pseudomonadota bacterium]
MPVTSRTLHLALALTPEGWRRDVRLTLAAGAISAVEIGAAAQAGDERHAVAIPGVANLHSHAFQRAMSGFTERRGPGADSFWSWREAMYRFALAMNPEQMEAVASQAYVEMLEAGFTRVGEFHYLHHAPDGARYDDIAEMSARIAAAAAAAQIGLTLAPVLYAHSGFGGAPPDASQRRFVCSLDDYARLVERVRAIVASLDGANAALAPHSLRAVTLDELKAVVELAGASPIHIHVAEQVAEVEACVAATGARPVEFLLGHAEIDRRWCLVHATHMTSNESHRLAKSGAVAGLCPITEANLGDGFFDAPEFLAHGGHFGIGSDSNVQIGLAEELRLLEYGQRLVHRARNVVATPNGSTGRALFAGAFLGGAAALGRARSGFAVGADADVVTLRDEMLDCASGDADGVLDRW